MDKSSLEARLLFLILQRSSTEPMGWAHLEQEIPFSLVKNHDRTQIRLVVSTKSVSLTLKKLSSVACFKGKNVPLRKLLL